MQSELQLTEFNNLESIEYASLSKQEQDKYKMICNKRINALKSLILKQKKLEKKEETKESPRRIELSLLTADAYMARSKTRQLKSLIDEEKLNIIKAEKDIKEIEHYKKIQESREGNPLLNIIKKKFASLKGIEKTDISYINWTINLLSSVITTNYVANKSFKMSLLIRSLNWATKWFFFLINDNIVSYYANMIFGISKKYLMYIAPILEGIGVYMYRNRPSKTLPNNKYLNSISFATSIASSTNSCEEQLIDFKKGEFRASIVGMLAVETIGAGLYYTLRVKL